MKNTANKPALERTTTTSSIVPKATSGASDGLAVVGDADVDAATPERRRFKEVWLVEDRREGKSMWTRVGTAFENNDGSWNIRLSALPVAGGRLNMRDPLVRTDEEREHRQSARKLVVLASVLMALPATAQMMSPGSSPSPSSSSLSSLPAGAPEPSPPSTLPMVNLNTATIEELCTLPGIGRKKAEAILALRQKKPLTRVTQLLQVKGIGAKTLQRLKPMLSVAPVSSTEAPPAVSGSPIMAAVRRP